MNVSSTCKKASSSNCSGSTRKQHRSVSNQAGINSRAFQNITRSLKLSPITKLNDPLQRLERISSFGAKISDATERLIARPSAYSSRAANSVGIVSSPDGKLDLRAAGASVPTIANGLAATVASLGYIPPTLVWYIPKLSVRNRECFSVNQQSII